MRFLLIPAALFVAAVSIAEAQSEEQLLPEKVKLLTNTLFDVVGSVDAAQFLVNAGTEVKVQKMVGGNLLVEHGFGRAYVDPEQTDISEREDEARAVANHKAMLRVAEAESKRGNIGVKRLTGIVRSVIDEGVLFQVQNWDGSEDLVFLVTSRTGLVDGDRLSVRARLMGEPFQYNSAGNAWKTVRMWAEEPAE